MVKKKLKKLISGALCVAMLCTMMPMSVFAAETSANSEQVSERKVYSGTNVGKQDYVNLQRWSKPMYSYLTECADGTLMRVQYVTDSAECVVEYYDSSYKLLRSQIIPQELPIFGGFYATDTNYYLLTGQENLQGAAGIEEFRVTKYDKNWNRIDAAGLTDSNTAIPFDAGSARMDHLEKYLAIRTCHKMYNGHQANVTLLVDTDTMEVTDQFTGIWNISTGYVSHSFNQFIKIEDGKVVSIDHGDANPRSVVLCKYGTDVSTGEFLTNEDVIHKDVVKYTQHPSNANITGATVGGFELSDSSYLVTGNQNTPEATDLDFCTRNIYLASVSKDTLDVTMHWLTSYKEGETSTRTPQMVKVSDNRFVVLWKRGNTLYYRECDGTGKPYGATYCMEKESYLSDCTPIVKDNKIIWYVWQNEIVIFYEIDLNNVGKVKATILDGDTVETEMFCADGNHDTEYVNKVEPTCTEKGSIASRQCKDCKLRFSDKAGTDKLSDDMAFIPVKGHDFERLKVENAIAYVKCKVCGAEDTKNIATSRKILIKVNDGAYDSELLADLKVGDVITYFITFYPYESEDELEVEFSDPDKVKWTEKEPGSVTFYGSIELKKPGKYSFTFRPKWNPDPYMGRTYEVDIPCDHKWDAGKITKKATCTAEGVKTFSCAVCNGTKTETLAKLPHKYTVTTKEPTCMEAGQQVSTCSVCNATVVKPLAKLPHKYNTVTTKATTTKNGSITTTCSGCADKKTTVIYYPKTITLSAASYTYNGKVKTPSVTVKDAGGKALIKNEDYTVSYEEGRKSPGKYAVTVTFKGNYSGEKTSYFKIVPKAPTSVSAKLYGYDDVKFSWSKSTGTTGYAVYYRKSTSSKYTYLRSVTGTYIKKSGLTDGAKYYFKVVPYKTIDGKKNYGTSKYTSVYTLKKLSTPAVSKYSSSKVKVKWKNINGESGYQISKSTSRKGTNIVATYKTTSGTYKNLSVKKGKTYYYKVRAYKTVDGKNIYGPWSYVKSYKLK